MTLAQLERLAIISEEMGESVQAVGKILRFGFEDHWPEKKVTNREQLEIEIGQVLYAIELMCMEGDMSYERIMSAKEQKARNHKYLRHQKKL